MDNNEMISGKQWRFWKGISTEGIRLQLTEKWESQIDRGYVAGIIFIFKQHSIQYNMIFSFTNY